MINERIFHNLIFFPNNAYHFLNKYNDCWSKIFDVCFCTSHFCFYFIQTFTLVDIVLQKLTTMHATNRVYYRSVSSFKFLISSFLNWTTDIIIAVMILITVFLDSFLNYFNAKSLFFYCRERYKCSTLIQTSTKEDKKKLNINDKSRVHYFRKPN